MLKWTVAGREGLFDRSDNSLDVTEDPLAAFTIGACKEYKKVYCVNR